MITIEKEELKRIIKENNLKTVDDLKEFFAQLEKEMVETMLEGEMESHLGYSRYDRENKKTENSRNGYTSKEVYGEAGKFRINVPRDRDSSFFLG